MLGYHFMKKLLLSKIVVMIVATVFLMLFAVIATLDIYNMQVAKDNIAITIRMLEDIIIDENIDTVEGYKRLIEMKNSTGTSNLRINILSIDGEIMADSLIYDIEEVGIINQNLKPEVIEAKKSHINIGYSIRNSDLHDSNFLYGAKVVYRKSGDIILRMSTSISYINRYVQIFSITIVLIMILFLTIPMLLLLPKFIASVFKPLEMMKNNLNSILENDFYYTKSITKYDEINSVLEEINEVSHRLKSNIEESEREKHKLNYVLENINQGLIALDENKHIVFINTFALKLLDVADNESKFLIEIIRDNTTEASIQQAIKERKYISFEYSPTSSTSNVILKIEVIPIYEGLHSLIKISDITEIKKFEIERNELFVNASHKLNTPLTSILGYSDMLLLNSQKPTSQNTTEISTADTFIMRINEQAKRMKELISDMLKLTKYQKSGSVYNDSDKSIVNLRNIVVDIIEEMSVVAEKKNIHISLESDGYAYIFGNAKHVEDAIENLLNNAIKYNRENGRVDISIKSMGDKIIFTISDKGIGIPQEYVGRVFERFFRVSTQRTKHIDGSGIGLAIVKHICSSHNAEISISSIENVGTDITIEFPKHKT